MDSVHGILVCSLPKSPGLPNFMDLGHKLAARLGETAAGIVSPSALFEERAE